MSEVPSSGLHSAQMGSNVPDMTVPHQATALDLLDDSYPHGTVEGYDRGCRTNHCPAPITCAVFRTRYVGDWGFRKRVDAGATAAEIAEAEAAEAVERAEAEKAAARAIRAAEKAERAAAARRNRPQSPRATVRARRWTADELATLRAMNADRKSDKAIAAALGRPHQSVHTKRRDLGLDTIEGPRRTHGTLSMYSRGGCRGDDCPATPSCGEIGRAYFRVKQGEARARARAAA